MTKSTDISADVAALLRARNPLIWIVTREEARVEGYLIEAAASANYIVRTWDVGQGVADTAGKVVRDIGGPDPGETLAMIGQRAASGRGERCVWIMRDLPPWLIGSVGLTTCRQLRNLARMLPGVGRENAQAIVIISPAADVPAELANHATVIEWPLPDREEITAILDAAIGALPEDMRASAAPNGAREAAIDAAVGLSGEEAQACYARSLVQLRRIDPLIVAKEKRRVVARDGLLEWFDPIPGGLSAVGGLDQLKTWLVSRKLAYSAAARAYGLPAPKGTMLIGISGCGKSLSAKAIATAWGIPLLKLDLGAMKSKFVGDSERRLRTAFTVVEAVGRCVLWIDEIDKFITSGGNAGSDGGVSADQLGALLSWMQERSGEGFVIATANDITGLPPELLRKGRFDEIWWVDLPNYTERNEVLKAALRLHGRGAFAERGDAAAEMEWDALCDATSGFTGSEIAAIVPDALFSAFADGEREIVAADLLAAAKTVVPLSKTAAEKIGVMREWAKGRARAATSAESVGEATQDRGRMIDL